LKIRRKNKKNLEKKEIKQVLMLVVTKIAKLVDLEVKILVSKELTKEVHN